MSIREVAMRKANGRRFFANCGCCVPNLAPSAPALSRRNLLSGGIAALGLGTAAVALGAPAVRAQARSAASPLPRIDVHHHFLPPAHAEALTKHQTPSPKWSPAMSLEEMDRSGIQTSILSQVQPGTWFGDVEESRKLTRQINEYGAKMVADHPGRFGLFATVTPLDVEGSLKEIEYAFDTLKADGLGLLTSYKGKYLGDAAFAPVWEELNRRRAVIYVHPLAPDCCARVVPGTPPGSIEYATDTTRTIAHLVFSGTSTKFPNIRWIWSHSGGTLPFLTQRFIVQQRVQKHAHLPNGPMPEFQKFYYELAQGNTPGQLAALLKMVSVAQVLYGTDYPYRDGAEVNAGIADWGFSESNLRAIERNTALKLLPRLRTA
jgi:predicted TIM-barrel fold metal-dependent hydrolase